MSASFAFKQFTIVQDQCAMKVGTDGVLLGAWATPKSGLVLDIGTGTGLIALMLAQRIKNAQIDAIEIEENAVLEAQQNVVNSKWNDRIKIIPSSLQSYFPNLQYDLIVSNPPFFTNAFQPKKTDRATARHTNNLTFDELILNAFRLLKTNGIFALVLPINEAVQFIEKAQLHHFFLRRKCEVKPNLLKAPKRVLLEFVKTKPIKIIEENLTIETNKRHHYTTEYEELTSSFYL